MKKFSYFLAGKLVGKTDYNYQGVAKFFFAFQILLILAIILDFINFFILK